MAISYMICENVLLVFKEGNVCAREFPDNLKPYVFDILKLESQIEFLQGQLVKDTKKMDELLVERHWRYEQSKTVAKIGVGISTSVSIVAAIVGADTFLETFSNFVTKSTPIFLTSLMFTLFLSSYPCSLSPSDNKINGFSEKILFEQEQISLLQQELENIKKQSNNEQYEDDKNMHTIDDSERIKYLRDSIKLRYCFGANWEVIRKYFNDGILSYQLKDEGFCDDAITDFIIFVEEKNALEQKEIEKELNLLKGN